MITVTPLSGSYDAAFAAKHANSTPLKRQLIESWLSPPRGHAPYSRFIFQRADHSSGMSFAKHVQLERLALQAMRDSKINAAE
jgi:hypothetical protein